MEKNKREKTMHPIAIFVIGMWVGVAFGILIIGLFNKENRD